MRNSVEKSCFVNKYRHKKMYLLIHFLKISCIFCCGLFNMVCCWVFRNLKPKFIHRLQSTHGFKVVSILFYVDHNYFSIYLSIGFCIFLIKKTHSSIPKWHNDKKKCIEIYFFLKKPTIEIHPRISHDISPIQGLSRLPTKFRHWLPKIRRLCQRLILIIHDPMWIWHWNFQSPPSSEEYLERKRPWFFWVFTLLISPTIRTAFPTCATCL